MKLSAILEWLKHLLPKQKMIEAGDGNIQAGRVEGDFKNNSPTHNTYNYNIVVAPETSLFDRPKPKPQSKATPTQEALLALMRRSSDAERIALWFMQREFGCTYVKALSEIQATRTIGYVETSIRNNQSKVLE